MKDRPFQGSNRAKILELYEAGKSPAEIARIMHSGKRGRPDNAATIATLDRYRPGWRLERKQNESQGQPGTPTRAGENEGMI